MKTFKEFISEGTIWNRIETARKNNDGKAYTIIFNKSSDAEDLTYDINSELGENDNWEWDGDKEIYVSGWDAHDAIAKIMKNSKIKADIKYDSFKLSGK